MNTSRARLAALGAAAALATTGAVAAASGSSTAVGVPTLDHAAADHQAGSTPGLRVTAAPAPCAHVAAGKMSSVITFHRKAASAPRTYAVTAVSPADHAIQTRSVRVGPGASTLQMVWQQRHHGVGAVTLTVKNAHGAQVAVVHEPTGGAPVAARCT